MTEFDITGTLAETDTAGWELRSSADSMLALTGRGVWLKLALTEQALALACRLTIVAFNEDNSSARSLTEHFSQIKSATCSTNLQ